MNHSSLIGAVIAASSVALLTGCGPSLKTVYQVDEDSVYEPTIAEQQPVAVAGSRIKRKVDPGQRATPVRIISREDIEQSGAASAGDLIGQGPLPW